jgi:S-adenosyl methyltransferase/Protein of unknown function (DUF3375)
VFVEENVRSIASTELAGRLDDELYALNQRTPESFPKPAKAYLDDWASPESGCGMPTVPNTQETAQAIIPDARVAYIDNDPVVLTHVRALAEHGNPNVTVVDGDVREPAEIVAAIQDDIDFEAPACLMMGYLLHFFAPDTARDLVANYVAKLAPGSHVVLSVGRADGEAAKQGFGACSSSGTRVYNHSVKDFASFFGLLKLVPPGVVDGREWYPDSDHPVHATPRDGQVIVGVARV